MAGKPSLWMIVRDEERSIARCLQSVKDAVDEIIVDDTGSTDRTVGICHSRLGLGSEQEKQQAGGPDRARQRILVASPVKQKPAILRLFLDSLAELDAEGLLVEY
ncbi:glycosyltransferase [Paenibacillus mendelii]|uniref:Glycosyltransferase n=1 Tax=Paenibacillus mendelii TaxID=206163 RepID=A0ABV6J969_9BACL